MVTRDRQREIISYYQGVKDSLLHQKPEMKTVSDACFEAEVRALFSAIVRENKFMSESEMEYVFNYFFSL